MNMYRTLARIVLGCAALLLGLASVSSSALAQGAEGTVVGRVQNANTRTFLEGAQVSVAGTSIRAVTSRDGSFTLLRVPAGRQILNVTYTGLDAGTEEIVVTAGGTQQALINLSTEVYQLEEFTVAGLREGNAASITKQRNAENLVNVVSMDTFGNVADGNVGNFLQNLPGVSVNKEAGDIVGINLRGTPPDLNAVTLDGTRTAAAIAGFSPQGDRASLIDQIPSEFIKEIEVTKASTPDMWADSLGGSVNLVTKSAFDFTDRVITYRVGASLNTYREGKWSTGWGPSMAFSYMDTFGPERKLAVSLSLSDTKTTNARDRVQMDYFFATDDRNTNARELNDVAERQRQGLGLKFEYRPDDSLKLSLSTVINRYNQDMVRRNRQGSASGGRNIADYNVVSRAAIEAGATPRTTTNAAAGVAPDFRKGYTELLNVNWLNQAAMETKRSKQLKIAFDVEKTWIDSSLSFSASFNPTSYDNNYQGFSANANNRGIGIKIDTTDADRPVYTQSMGPLTSKGADFSLYTGQRFESPDRTTEDIVSVGTKYTKELNNLRYPVKVQAGLGYRSQDRIWSRWRPSWDFVGADGVVGLNPATGRNDDEIGRFIDANGSYGLFNGAMSVRDALDYNIVKALSITNPSYFRPRGTTVSNRPLASKAREDVYAAYLQGTIDMKPLTILTGLRVEQTDVTATGSFSDPLKPLVPQTTQTGDYQKLFPSVHLRYEPRQNLLFRASYSTSSARPAISDITPATTVSHNIGSNEGIRGSVKVNNSDLRPQFSQNWDFSAEYYLNPVGLISVGVFRKDISDYIASFEAEIGTGANNGFGGEYADYSLSTKTNFGKAKIDGLEINYSQQLTMLPAPLNRLSVFANYTKLETEGTYSGGATQLAGFVPEARNAGVSFSWKNISTSVRYNLKSSYVIGLNSNPQLTRFVTDDPTMDVNVSYRFSSALSVYVDVINVFNKSPSWYNKDQHRILMSELYGSRLSVGISGRF
jgi:iron complex outermembrane recepter protein